MSQLSQQNDGLSDSQLFLFAQDSPTIGRSQVNYAPNNSSPLAESGKRSLRKAAPSPLTTSTTANSPPTSVTPTRSTFGRAGAEFTFSPTSKSQNDSPVETPRSPKERLDDLLASERSFYSSADSSVESIPEEEEPIFPRPANNPNGNSRSVSDSSIASRGSPTTIRPQMATMAPAHRVEMARPPPRTSSIDSAISSISGSVHSHKGSQDTISSPDIANLIHAAGSAETVIQYLLKEKQSQTAQNTQLWRLVDKQRAMILGLNKDLERALKDKERYRKKLKESLAQISNPSPVESNVGMSETGSVRSDSITDFSRTEAHPESVGALISAGLREPQQENLPSPINVALAPYPITPPAAYINAPQLSNMVAAEHKMPSPTQHAFQQFNPDSPQGFEAGQQQRKQNEIAREVPYNASLPPSRSLPSDPPRGPPPSIPPPKAPMSSQNPSVSVIEASPNPNESLKAFSSPPRKAPPAPLNLRKLANPSAHLREASGAGDDSDSDYDDILEVDEIPVFPERGRRKTREDDDRQREVAAAKDAELRSLSKKSGKSTPKSRPTTPKEGAFSPSLDTMPASPRQAIPISPPDAHMRHLSPPDSNSGSLAGMLSEAAGVVSPPLLSPGLPMSPRPTDRPLGSPLPRTMNSPPMSPRMGGFPGAVPLSPRAPRQPIPLPPNTPMSISSPGIPKGGPLHLVSPKPLIISKRPNDSAISTLKGEDVSPLEGSPTRENAIYKGLVTEEYPDLLLPPNALPSIDVRVASSRLKPSRSSILFPKNFEEDPVFTLAVFARSDRRELWRCEKDSASLANLDHMLKQSPTFVAKTPERSLFSGHAPAKVDARRIALDKYLEEVLNTQMDLTSALEVCRYLSTNTMEPHAGDVTPSGDSINESPIKTGPGGRPLKHGYLTKRGKNFGGWKARFFVLDGPVFKYYESPGGPHLGAIKLQNAQIGKQQTQADNQSPSRGEAEDTDNQYRHAFLILEPKRKDSSSLVRHVLCAESDQERDEWVEALLQYVDYKDSDEEDPAKTNQQQQHDRKTSGGSASTNGAKPKKKKSHTQTRGQNLADSTDSSLRSVSYENTKPGGVPAGFRAKNGGTPSPPAQGYEKDPMSQMSQSHSTKNISGPKNAQVIQDAAQWGNRQLLAPAPMDVRQKKRSFFGFGTKPRPSTESQEGGPSDSSTNLTQMAFEQHGPIRPAFGAPLGESVRYNHPVNVNIELPAVVYRCIEYLDAKNAANEEGIFRLSGSNVLIKQLRERFNVEGDINLVAEAENEYYDIHAVASLLKLFLRELPTTILTRELHLEFLAVTELHEMSDKIRALNGLVYRLPRPNHALLRYLAGFLLNIISHADTNKMTVRNVGIVFSPTLNIPAPVFALFLQQYHEIFDNEPDSQNGPVEVSVTAPPLSPEDIRSPRHQKFQDLPTPSYNQQSFPQSQQSFPQSQAPPFPMPQHYQQRENFDTGFMPVQQSYDQSGYPTMAGPEYGRSTPTLAGPSYDQYNGGNVAYRQYGSDNPQGTGKKRRESSMFGIGLGQRKASSSKLKDDSRLVEDESFFD